MSEHGTDGDDHGGDDLLETLPAVIAVATLGIGATTAILGLGQVTAIVFVVGWLFLTPLSAILGETAAVQNLVGSATGERANHSSTTQSTDDEAALEALKRRYARGELDDAEFERRTAMLLENESIEDVRSRVEGTTREAEPAGGASRASADRDRQRDRAADGDGASRDREPEYET